MNVLSKEDERQLLEAFTRMGRKDPAGDVAHSAAELNAALAAGKLSLHVDEHGKLSVDRDEVMKLWPAKNKQPNRRK